MDFEEFKEAITKDVKKAVDERLGTNTEVEIRHNNKTNYSYDALIVRPEGAEVGVSLDSDQLYKGFENGIDYNTIVSGAADQAAKALKEGPEFDIDMFSDYGQMKEKLSIEVISAERNADILVNVPHKNLEDMAIVYRFNVGMTPEGRGTILVTNDMLDKYGITAEQLHADALESAPEIRPVVIKGMSEFLAEMMGAEQAEMLGFAPVQDEPVLVASVPDNIKGAGIIAYTDFMDKAAERIGGDFYILPASIHEVLLVKDDGMVSKEHLEMMVKEVNATTVDPSEQLTDSVYHYDSKEKIFELADKFEARTKGEKEIVGKEKGSLMAEIKEKQKEVAATPKKETPEIKPKAKGGEAK
ncbi:DUF5688 family protein [Butyrivibrio sp. YAB3001]|uniref:DUF5688 family protein n=1 Tax=Butyrivibrio sp. YAB3001 TaxID=1520812 RepID=UPI0008F65AE0|nr:DUF5688 family protein [Butyrivibrio sp. YAB3001]SFC55899.1 hypothetical protein SAMN02910398_02561 [Butyrivibrio sp. YAB3001]